ncbi:uncharacterized protein LOC126811885 [Patella vulgata]|uniref:uncharacterized protein LOC126811885 n=1 Tax=Patella vulgata TaxID=6465 RepID=UPI00217FFF92|nr:uncharacterized protein LOC126811885 [Patella vulgata]
MKDFKINPNSKAYNEGVKVGDYVEAVNGHRTENINIGDTQLIIKNASDELLLQLRRSEPKSNGVLNGDIHHSSDTHVNSGAGRRPALRSNKMDSYHNQTPSSSTSGWSQYGGEKNRKKNIAPLSLDATNTLPTTNTAASGSHPISMKDFINFEADAVFSQSPPTRPKYKQSISLPMSPTSSERSFVLPRQPLSPGSYPHQQLSGSYIERATRPLDIRWGERRHRSSMQRLWVQNNPDSFKYGNKSLYTTKPASSYGVKQPHARSSPSLSPAGSTRGLYLFRHQQEKNACLSDDSQEINVEQSNQQHNMQPYHQGHSTAPYYTSSQNLGHKVPRKASFERNVPITVLAKPQRNRSASESDPYGLNLGPVPDSGFSSWQSGLSEPPKQIYSAGSYATLPVKRSAKQQQPAVKTARDTNTIQHQNDGHFDFNLYSTLPTIKPLKSTQKVESSDNIRQNQGFQYSKPVWTNQEQPRQPPLYQSYRGTHGDSTPSNSSTLTSSDSHDTIVSGSKEVRKPINVIHEEMKPIQVVHEESKPTFFNHEEKVKPQKIIHEQFKPVSIRPEEMIKPKRAVREQARPQQVAEVQEEIIVPQKKEDVQAKSRVTNTFGSLPKTTKTPSQKKDLGTFNTLPSKSTTSPTVKPSQPVLNGNVTSHHTVGPLSPTSKPGVWSPGMKPSTFKKTEPEISPIEPPRSDSSFSVKPIWTPGGSPSGVRKEFKPVKLCTAAKPVLVERPKPKVISPSVKPEIFEWKPQDSPSAKDPTINKVPTSVVQYQLAGSKLESLLPEAIQNAPHMNGSVDNNLLNDSKDDLHLPQTQSPYITLLKKSRESEKTDDIKNLGQPIMVTKEGQFPKGAKYIGKVESHDGDVQHTDEYYTTKHIEEESSSKVIEQKPKIFEGIGPVDHEGVPLAFRKNIDEKNQHAWYRQMYKNLHKTEKKDELLGINDIIDSIFEDAVKNIEENTYRPTYQFPEDHSDTKSVEAKTKEKSDTEVNGKVNPYRPSYELPSRFADESGYRSEPEGRSYGKPKNRSKSISDESRRLYNYPPPQVRSKIEVYRNQPRSIMDYEPGFSSLAFQEVKTNSERRQRSHSVHSTARKQNKVHNPPIDKPGQFSNYTVGGKKQIEAEPLPDDHPGDDKESYKRVQLGGEIPIHGLQKPAPPKPKKWTPAHVKTDEQYKGSYPNAQNTNLTNVVVSNSEPNLTRYQPEATSKSQPISPSNVPSPPARTHQSPTIKPAKLRMPRSSLSAVEQLGVKNPPLVKTNENGAFKHQTSDVIRSVPMSEKERRRKEEDKLYRRQRLEQLYEEERKRKALQEEQDIQSRRHNDFFMPSMKSPISNDRFNETNGMVGGSPTTGMTLLSVPAERRRGFQIQGKARAKYTFNAQNARELSFRKGDIIYLLRQIDKNWFEGDRHGTVGIFPVNYVEVMTSIEAAQAAAVQAEGQGRVKYNFTAQSPVELSLRKGEYVTLLRTVDENWYEGRSGNKQGIFPAAYIEIIQEPSTPLITPAPSVICTPMTGRGTPEMLSPVGYDAPTPPPQPSPSAFNQSRFPATQFGYRQQQQQSPGALRSQSNPLSPINQELEQRILGQIKPQLSPTQPKKQVTINTVTRQEAKPVATKPSYGVKSKVPDDDLAINRYRAIYMYKPQNEDELELQEGDEIYVMEQCDDGWYVGTSGRTGNFGTFPGNYVQLI